MNKEFESTQYDQIYYSGGADKIYDLPYRQSGYFPLFQEVLRTLKANGATSVLEVGCGTGGFAHLLFDQGGRVRYRGFDFSGVAVDRSRARTRRSDLFFVGDARRPDSYAGEFDSIVCTEVLEHINCDLEVIENWRPGIFCVCSVPNFDADNHVRFFCSKGEVQQRYGTLIDIKSVVQIKKPVLLDISWRGYARALRWNRYRPRQVMEILGMTSFDKEGGWYVFSGPRRGKG